MEAPPITLFSKKVDPEGVMELVLDHYPEARIVEDDQGWSIIIEQKRHVLSRTRALEINHEPDYYLGKDWDNQRMKLAGHLADAPMSKERHLTMLPVILEFEFALAFVAEPAIDVEKEDYRYSLILKIAQHLNGCLFLFGGHLLDSQGRVLVHPDGDFDPEAVFPKVENPLVDVKEDGEREEVSSEEAS